MTRSRAWLIVAWCTLAPSSALAQAAPSSPMPHWLDVGGEYRIRVEALEGARFQADNRDGYVLNRVRFGATVRPGDVWRGVVQVQDSRVFFKAQQPARPPFQDVVDLRLAYVEFGAPKDPAVTVRIGRQEIAFGEQRLLGTADWLNTGRVFDAARVRLAKSGVTIDGFGAYIVRVIPDRRNISEPGTVIYGASVGLTRLGPHVMIEPFVFARRAPSQLLERGGRDVLHTATIGARWTIAGGRGLDVSGEMAGQAGAVGTEDIRAWAGHWNAGFTPGTLAWKPRVFGEYNYASGDHRASDGHRQTFDQLYPTAHDKYGLADQVGWKNVHHLRAGLEMKPARRIVTTVRYHSWWLATTSDALYDASGAAVVAAPGPGVDRHVGQEADVQTTWTASEKLRIAAGYAHIFPGALLQHAIDARPLTYPYLSLNVAF